MTYNPYEIKFTSCSWSEISESVESYIRMNQMVIDAFWEDHVLESNHYKMLFDDTTIGYFSIHNHSTIMLFCVIEEFRSISQELFARIKKWESISNAMVTTGDELFISHCLDNFVRIEKQAYFSVYTNRGIPNELIKPIQLHLADINDKKDLETLQLSKGFLNEEIEKIKNDPNLINIYIVELNQKTVGFGVIQYGRVLADIASIGMYVCEPYRCQGIASNILENLKQISIKNGFKAISGCWYYNHNSKKAMELAGAYSKTRLVRFYF